jgi:hypothetical protein
MAGNVFVVANFFGEERLRGQIRAGNKLGVQKAAHETAMAAKAIVDVITGTLLNSISVYRPSQVRDRTDEARSRDLGDENPEPEGSGDKVMLAVGGTAFYAFFEELLHPYMEPAMRSVSADAIYGEIRKAF